MQNVDLIVLKKLRDWRQQSMSALLVTVVRTWGSSPRPVGSIMALCEDGSVVGSVSGGCIEDDLIARHRGPANTEWHSRVGTETLIYGVSAEEAYRFGLPCGGTLKLMAEYNPCADTLTELLDALEERRLMQRNLRFSDGHVSLTSCDVPQALTMDDTSLTATFGPGYRMLLIGAGTLAEYLSTMALFSGFKVTVCDPRIEYRRGWSLSGVDVVHDMPDDAVLAFKADQRSCIVALSHDPKLDDMALLEALHSDAFYVGAIGSRRNQDARRARMIEFLDQTEDVMDRLHGPVGLYIGSKTPSEIAVSIMAEIIAIKNNVQLPRSLDVRRAKEALQDVA